MKIRFRMRRKIAWESITFFFAMFFIFSYMLLEHVSISIPQFSMVKMPLLYGGAVCLLTQMNLFLRNFKKKKYFGILFVLVLFIGLLLISAYVNRSTFFGSSPMYATMRLALSLIELFLLAMWAAERGKSETVFNFLFWYVLTIVILTDTLLLSRILVFNPGKHETYLIGTKFTVSYIHMELLVLWYIRNRDHFYGERKSKRIVLLSIFLILAVMIRVNCVTGILGAVALFVMFMLLNTQFQRHFLRFTSPMLLGLSLIISVLFPFLAEKVTQLPTVEFIIETILGRDRTITGRLNIFRIFGRKMEGHWIWGYGCGNSNVASQKLFGYANAQNALLDWIIQIGIPATIVLCVIMLLIICQIHTAERRRKLMPIVMLVYVYVILGCIETTFNMNFIMWLALIFMSACERPKVRDLHL